MQRYIHPSEGVYKLESSMYVIGLNLNTDDREVYMYL